MKGPSMQDIITPATTRGLGAAGVATSADCPLTDSCCLAWGCGVGAEAIDALILTALAFNRKAGSDTVPLRLH